MTRKFMSGKYKGKAYDDPTIPLNYFGYLFDYLGQTMSKRLKDEYEWRAREKVMLERLENGCAAEDIQ